MYRLIKWAVLGYALYALRNWLELPTIGHGMLKAVDRIHNPQFEIEQSRR